MYSGHWKECILIPFCLPRIIVFDYGHGNIYMFDRLVANGQEKINVPILRGLAAPF